MRIASINSRLILHAPNVHSGGGLTLLKVLIEVLPKGAYLIVDERLPITNDELLGFEVYRIKPTLWSRFKAEVLLKRLSSEVANVLCFGNLPPLFCLKSKVFLYIQNRYLVDPQSISFVPFKLWLRLTMECFWLRFFERNANHVFVQTASMKALTDKYVSAQVTIAPFAKKTNLLVDYDSAISASKKYDFVYVASGDSHKNHKNLVAAWVRLARDGLFPSLCLTVDSLAFPEITALIESKIHEYGLKIDNLGLVAPEDVMEIYKKSDTLIFPSTLESFGLPLIEAKNAGLKIIASELDYVRDILDPDETFDPYSSISIVRAIERFLKKEREEFNVLDAQDFINFIVCE